MAVKAYVLIEVEVGKAGAVVDAVQKLEGVKSADSVAGPYDVVTAIEAEELDAVGNLVKQIHWISGICKTTTLIGVKF